MTKNISVHFLHPLHWGFQYFVLFPLNLLCYPYLTILQLFMIFLVVLPSLTTYFITLTIFELQHTSIAVGTITLLFTIAAVSYSLLPEGIKFSELNEHKPIKYLTLSYIFPVIITTGCAILSCYSLYYGLGIFFYSWLFNNFLILYFIVIKDCPKEDQ